MNDFVSIIVPSYLKADVLEWFFYSLTQQKISYDYEIIICNDGIRDDTKDICNKYKNKLNIHYIFTGQRNKNKLIHRMPGFAFNIAVKKAKGDILILTQPDIFLLDNCIDDITAPIIENKNTVAISNGKDDDGRFLKKLKNNNLGLLGLEKTYNLIPNILNTELPFFMGLSKDKYNNIGGYDEDFTGYCSDDRDFIDRLHEDKSEFIKIDKRIIHLYHPRTAQYRQGLDNLYEAKKYNRGLYIRKQQMRLSKKQNIINKISLNLERANKDIKIIDVKETILPSTIKKQRTENNKWYLEKIPKIAYFYWGNKTLPFLRYLTVKSFHKYNPDWKIKFYYPKHIQTKITWTSHEQKYEINGKDYYNELKKLPIQFIEFDFKSIDIDYNLSEVHKSDYLRWHLLSTIGGLWSDMDIIYFKSMNETKFNIQSNTHIDTIICHHDRFKHKIGFLLSSPDNKHYKFLWDKSLTNYNSEKYQCIGVELMNQFTPKQLIEKYPNTLNISTKEVYPYVLIANAKKIYTQNISENVIEDSIGLHWYAGHKSSQNYINKMTAKNYYNFKGGLVKIISKVMGASIKISIIIPSFGRPELLDYGLMSLSQQHINYPYEVIVLNDKLPDETEEICAKYPNIKYIFTGQRNSEDNIKWRIPGFAFNIGVKAATGNVIILTCPEIYHLNSISDSVSYLIDNKKNVVYPDLVLDDRKEKYLNELRDNKKLITILDTIEKSPKLNNKLPFFLMLWKQEFIDIGGYDEDFTGNCWDDDDIINRLKKDGCNFIKSDTKTLHLYHKRHNYKSDKIMREWNYNKKLYERRKDIIIRNQDKEWGNNVSQINTTTNEMISIIMTTYNRRLRLDNSLYSIVTQKKPKNVEIIIVDDGSNDNTQTMVEKYQQQYPEWNIKYIYNKKFNKYSNPSNALNIALIYATGSIIIQSGADILHLGEPIEVLLNNFFKSEAYYATRLCRLPKEKVDEMPLYNKLRLISYVKKYSKEQAIMPIVIDSDKNNTLPFCAIYRKEWAYKIGLYDEEYLSGGAEDRDFVYRMQKIVPTRWCYDTWVCHQNHDKFSSNQPFSYGYSVNYKRSFNTAEGRENRWVRKILLVGHFNLFPFSGFLWDSLKQSFMRLGHYCKFYDPFPHSNNNEDLINGVKNIKNWDSKEVKDELQQIVNDFQPNIIFQGVQNTWHLVNKLKTNALKVSLYGDMHPPSTLNNYKNTLDCLFITNESQINEYKNLLKCLVYPLAFAVLSTAHYQRKVDKIYDVGFAGKDYKKFRYMDIYRQRTNLLEQIDEKFKLKCLENDWTNTWKFYSQCKILIADGCNLTDNIKGYTSNRFFNIMGCGSFCLVRYFPSLEFWGEPNKHFVTYHSNEEALDKIKYYLENKTEREKIAKEGYRWFHTYHNWIIRIKYINGILKNLLKK